MKKIFWVIILMVVSTMSYAQTWDDLWNEGFDYYQHGKYKAAVESFSKALNKAKSDYGEVSAEYAKTLHALGKVYDEAGLYETAVKYYLNSLDIKKQIFGTEHNEYATGANNLGTTYLFMGDYVLAENYLIQSRDIRLRLNGENSQLYSQSLNNLAYLYQMMNRYSESEKIYLETLGLREKMNGRQSEEVAQVLNNLGYLYMFMGRYKDSEKCYFEALEIRKNVLGVNHPDYGATLNNLGALYDQLGLFDQAVEYYRQYELIIERILGKTHQDYGLVCNNLAMALKNLNQYDEAEKYYLAALEVIKSTNGQESPYYALALSNIASLYKVTRRYKEAIDYYKQSMTILEKKVGTNQPSYAANLVSLAVMYHKADYYDMADSNYLKALQIYESMYEENNMKVAGVQFSLGCLNWSRNKIDVAHSYFLKSMNTLAYHIGEQSDYLSESEMSKFISDNSKLMTMYYSFFTSNAAGNPGMVQELRNFHHLISGKLLENSSQLKSFVTNSGDTSLVNKFNQWNGLKISIANEMSKPVKYRNKHVDEWVTNSGKLEKELTRLINNNDFGNQSELSFDLSADEILIEFVSFNHTSSTIWTDSIYYGAIITQSGNGASKYVPLFEESNLMGLLEGDTVRTFSNLLYTQSQVRNVEHDITYGDSLYQLIWKPLTPFLKGIKRVYFSPSGLLHNLSHSAIPLGNGQLLSDEYDLLCLSSSKSIAQKKDATFNVNSATLFGGIVYELDTTNLQNKKKLTNTGTKFKKQQNAKSRGGSWSYLPGSLKEVDGIQTLLKKSGLNVQVYSGSNGTEEIVKSLDGSKSPAVLHFSTHGFFFPDPQNSTQSITDDVTAFTSSSDPLLRSGLLFYGGNYTWQGHSSYEGMEDGILTASEVANLYLPNTSLVVMSACETGLGDVKGSEGVYGLQRAFKMAGVDYLIVTLWQVLDKETSEFMILFYQNLIKAKSIPSAFKSTQDAMKNKYRDEPYKWAGFVLIH